MYGVVPAKTMVRLLVPAEVGATTITVETGLTDWAVGDKIWLAPTSFQQHAVDYRTISAIDTATGVITVNAALAHYHFGAATSTAATYNNVVDIRGEVVLLSRNVRIVGDNTDLN